MLFARKQTNLTKDSFVAKKNEEYGKQQTKESKPYKKPEFVCLKPTKS